MTPFKGQEWRLEEGDGGQFQRTMPVLT